MRFRDLFPRRRRPGAIAPTMPPWRLDLSSIFVRREHVLPNGRSAFISIQDVCVCVGEPAREKKKESVRGCVYVWERVERVRVRCTACAQETIQDMDGSSNFHAQYCNIIIIHTPAGKCSELLTKNKPKVRNVGGALLRKTNKPPAWETLDFSPFPKSSASYAPCNLSPIYCC
jgi:hypothetical protein